MLVRTVTFNTATLRLEHELKKTKTYLRHAALAYKDTRYLHTHTHTHTHMYTDTRKQYCSISFDAVGALS